MEAILYVLVVCLLTTLALLWVIRLALCCGVDDALKKSRGWSSPSVRADRS